jgi:hypothetical protein
MVFNVTFKSISVITWQSVLLVQETGVHGENRQPVTSHLQTNIVYLYIIYISILVFSSATFIQRTTDFLCLHLPKDGNGNEI